MFGPYDETPQHDIDSAMAAYGPQLGMPDLEYEQGIREQIDFHRMLEQDQMRGAGMFASSPTPSYADARGTTREEPVRMKEELPPLAEDQRDARLYLMDTLTKAQRDALLVLVMAGGADEEYDDLLRDLWAEFDREQARARRNR